MAMLEGAFDSGVRRPGRWRGAHVALATAALATGVAACVPEPSLAEGPYAQEFALIVESDLSDFQREVLADEVVTREEYVAAHELLAECVSARGLQIEIEEQPSGALLVIRPDGVESGDLDDAIAECSAGTTRGVSYLYTATLFNPARASFELLMGQCLVLSGAVPTGATLELAYEEFMNVMIGAPSVIDPAHPGYIACVVDPRSAGEREDR